MTDPEKHDRYARQDWEKPEMTELPDGLRDVRHGASGADDGASGVEASS